MIFISFAFFFFAEGIYTRVIDIAYSVINWGNIVKWKLPWLYTEKSIWKRKNQIDFFNFSLKKFFLKKKFWKKFWKKFEIFSLTPSIFHVTRDHTASSGTRRRPVRLVPERRRVPSSWSCWPRRCRLPQSKHGDWRPKLRHDSVEILKPFWKKSANLKQKFTWKILPQESLAIILPPICTGMNAMPFSVVLKISVYRTSFTANSCGSLGASLYAKSYLMFCQIWFFSTLFKWSPDEMNQSITWFHVYVLSIGVLRQDRSKIYKEWNCPVYWQI